MKLLPRPSLRSPCFEHVYGNASITRRRWRNHQLRVIALFFCGSLSSREEGQLVAAVVFRRTRQRLKGTFAAKLHPFVLTAKLFVSGRSPKRTSHSLQRGARARGNPPRLSLCANSSSPRRKGGRTRARVYEFGESRRPRRYS